MKPPSRWARPLFYICMLLNTALLIGCGEKQDTEETQSTPAPNTAAEHTKTIARKAAENATQPPGTPGGITATASDKTIKISWDAVPNALQYNIYLAGEPGVQPRNYWKLNNGSTYITTDLSYINTELENGVSYYFVVTAVNNKGESPMSTQITATPKPIARATLDAPKPHVPAGLVATAQSNQVTLSWEPVKGASQYNIYMATEFGVNPHIYNKLQNGMAILNVSNPYTHQGLSNNTVYYFVVTAENRSGESHASTEAYATPLRPIPLPATPTQVRAKIGDGQITLHWQKSANADHYNVYMATKAGIDTTISATIDTEIYGTTDTELAGNRISRDVHSPFIQRELVNGQNYYFVVTAENKGGESPASTELKLSPGIKSVKLKPPTKVLISEIDKKTIISWSDVPGAAHYNVYMASESGVGANNYRRLENGAAKLNVNSPLPLENLPIGTTFYFTVSTVNKAGESPVSTEVSITTEAKEAKTVNVVSPVDKRQSTKYVVLDGNGQIQENQTLNYTQQPWPCVKSNTTGLVWEVKTNKRGLHNKNNTYSWFSSDNAKNNANNNVAGTQDGGVCQGSRCDTAAYIEAINAAKLCGFNDWRLPTRKELAGLIEKNVVYPDATIDNESFPNTAKSFHWSSTSYSHNPELAWFVYFGSGYEYYEYKSFASHIRLVRGLSTVANLPSKPTAPK